MTLRNLAHLRTILTGRMPGQLVIQITNYCNASCPQCGMRKDAALERFTLPPSQVKAILDQCAAKGIDAVSLTGGEPFIFPEAALDLLRYAGRRGIPFLRSGTNGFMFTHEGKAAEPERISPFVQALAATGIRNFWISLDSADTQTHETKRGLPGVIEGIRRALPLFHALRRGQGVKAFCKKCHWECFRDPSQLFGVARYLIRHPLLCLVKKRLDPVMLKFWAADIRYYIRNDFFNGRKAIKSPLKSPAK